MVYEICYAGRALAIVLAVMCFQSIEADYYPMYRFAGGSASPTGGFAGNGGQATAASLTSPTGSCIDTLGLTYINDYGNHQVHMVDTSGIISTLFGSKFPTISGNNGASTAANGRCWHTETDTVGNLFIADYENKLVRRISGGMIYSFAGGGSVTSGEGISATSASLNTVYDATPDSAGNVYVSGYSYTVRKISISTGKMYTVAGTGTVATTEGVGANGDGGQATSAAISAPWNFHVDTVNRLYISTYFGVSVRRVDLVSGIISFFAGNGVTHTQGDGGPATSAGLYTGTGIASDTVGNVYISGQDGKVRKVDNSGIINLFAGGGFYRGTSVSAATDFEIRQTDSIYVRGDTLTFPDYYQMLVFVVSLTPSTYSPTYAVTASPSREPSIKPTFGPTTLAPSACPTLIPTVLPSISDVPTYCPTLMPSELPSTSPSAEPSLKPTAAPTIVPTICPSVVPSVVPTTIPTFEPTVTWTPTNTPTTIPTVVPSVLPSTSPSLAPTVTPTFTSTEVPTVLPTYSATLSPSALPSLIPTVVPSPVSAAPSAPTRKPSVLPSVKPSRASITLAPTFLPTVAPTAAPTTHVDISFNSTLILMNTTDSTLTSADTTAVVSAVSTTLNLTSGVSVVNSGTVRRGRRLSGEGGPPYNLLVVVSVQTSTLNHAGMNGSALYHELKSVLMDAVESRDFMSALSVSAHTYSAYGLYYVSSVNVSVSEYSIVPVVSVGSDDDEDDAVDGLSEGAVAGIVVGGVVLVLMVVMCGYFGLGICRNKAKRVGPQSTSESA